MVSPILLLLLAVIGVSLAVTEHPLSPIAPRSAAPKGAAEGKAKSVPVSETAVYTGNDPDILNLVSMLQRNGFTDNDELREALRILRPEKFAKGDAKGPRAKRQAGVVPSAKKEGLDEGKLQPDSPSNLPNAESQSSESSSAQTAVLLPPPDTSNQKEEPKKEGKKKGLEKIDPTEEKSPPLLSQSNRLKRSRAPPIRTPNSLDSALNTPKTPYIPQ